MRALELCEALYGREETERVIASCNDGELPDILQTPADKDFTLKLRETINEMIEKAI